MPKPKKLAKAQKNKSRPSLLGKGAIKAIHSALDSLFDKIKARFLGPKSLGGKQIRFTYERPLSIPGLYESGLIADGAKPNLDTLDSLVHVAGGYVDSLRENSKANVVHTIQSFIRDAHQRDIQTDFRTILGGQLADLWQKTSSKLETIVNTEATKVRNVSALEGILEINASKGIEDPVVYWIVVKDGALCNECRRLHLMGDGHTPRLWFMSEVNQGYHKRGNNFPAIGGAHPHCLTGNMRIHTDRGMLTAKELFEQGGSLKAAVDNRVKVRRQGNNQFGAELDGQVWYSRHASGARMLDASHVYDTGVQPCYRIELDSGHVIEVSEGHEMWVDDGKSGYKTRADNLKVGDKVPLLSGEGAFGNDSFPELAELMGNLMGDGYIGPLTANFNFFGDDIEYGRHLKSLAAKFSHRMDEELVVSPPDDKYSVVQARFVSQVLRRIFVEEFELSKTPRRVPRRIWSADKSTVAGYLRGLFAADGHSEVTPAVVLGQNDLEFLREIQALLSNFGIRARIFDHDEAMQKTITYADGSQYVTNRKECWRLHIGGWAQVDLFAKEIGLGVPAKQQKLMERLKATEGKARNSAWRTAKVASITPMGEQQTYCLTEPKTNTITVNGIVTGNCRCTMVTLLPSYGFDAAGKVEFKKFGYMAIDVQRGTNKAEDMFPGLLLSKDEHKHEENPLEKSLKSIVYVNPTTKETIDAGTKRHPDHHALLDAGWEQGFLRHDGKYLSAQEAVKYQDSYGTAGWSRAHIDTPQFQEWFKGSKAVNETGAPMNLYHGGKYLRQKLLLPNSQPEKFWEFKPTESERTMGGFAGSLGATYKVKSPVFFFSEDPKMAAAFAVNRGPDNSFVHNVHLSVKNPIDLTGDKRRSTQMLKKLGINNVHGKSNIWQLFDDHEAVEKLKAAGHDGAIISEADSAKDFGVKGKNATRTWVAFHPTQIKSATHNAGDYSPTEPDIRKALPPYNPATDTSDKERQTISDWQNYADTKSRNAIPRLTGAGRERALHKLHGKTEARRNPTTGEREFLLHRGVGNTDKLQIDNGVVSHKGMGSWTFDPEIAQSFGKRRKGTVSAWIPESAIHHVLDQVGYVNDAATARVHGNEPKPGISVPHPTDPNAVPRAIGKPGYREGEVLVKLPKGAQVHKWEPSSPG